MQSRLWLTLFCALLLLLGLAQGDPLGVPISLTVNPSVVKQGDQRQSVLRTKVTLQQPSPDFFICEVRSQEKRKVSCTNIIFRKGETEGQGTATVFWQNVPLDSAVTVSAFNIQAPETNASFTIRLRVK